VKQNVTYNTTHQRKTPYRMASASFEAASNVISQPVVRCELYTPKQSDWQSKDEPDRCIVEHKGNVAITRQGSPAIDVATAQGFWHAYLNLPEGAGAPACGDDA
jgi:hypothetical protein